MSEWSLENVLSSLHDDIHCRLKSVRESIGHPGTKGSASESTWAKLLDTYLPRRYQAAPAHVVDSEGRFSEQLDVVVFDRQYSPLIFQYADATIIPAESVYAVFEAKQTINAELVEYAQKKVASVRRLHRTSMPIPWAKGVIEAREPPRILGGFLCLESDWSPALGRPLGQVLGRADDESRLDIGCVAAHGMFVLEEDGSYRLSPEPKAATAFLFELIARLQSQATVPMLDVRVYAAWLRRGGD